MRNIAKALSVAGMINGLVFAGCASDEVDTAYTAPAIPTPAASREAGATGGSSGNANANETPNQPTGRAGQENDAGARDTRDGSPDVEPADAAADTATGRDAAADAAASNDAGTEEDSGAAYTGHTIAIDGTNDFAVHESIGTSSATYGAFVAWDAANVYIAYSGTDLGSGATAGKWLHVYFDSAPGGSPTSEKWNSQQHTLPFAADAYLAIRPSDGTKQWRTWNGTKWIAAGVPFTSARNATTGLEG